MNQRILIVVMFLLSMMAGLCAGASGLDNDFLNWNALPDLPNSVGVAGPFVGISDDALIVAGGANFPDAPPWQGGKKIWYDEIHVLEKNTDGDYQWLIDNNFKLPRPLAYGVSINTQDGIVCIGGCDSQICYEDVFLMKWDSELKKIEIESLPSLPDKLAFMSGGQVDNVIYITGGQQTMKDAKATKIFWALDLSKKGSGENFKWEKLDPWPGASRILPLTATQSDGTYDCFYMFGGRNMASSKDTELLTDSYCYNPVEKSWKMLTDITVDDKKRCIMAGTAIASGANHILFFGGADGKLFLELEQLQRDTEQTANKTKAETAKKELLQLLNNHPGFSNDILAYHTITDTWVKAGKLPTTSHVTTTAVKWDGSFVIPTGEIRPGIRTPKIWKGQPITERSFGVINYSILGIYLLTLVGMGVYFSRRERTTDDFFKAGGRIPWWAAGLSIFGTQLSASTFMAIPAKAFATDWRYFILNMTIIMVAPFIVFMFLPFFRRLNVTSAYEYLEKRFNLASRLIGCLMFIALQMGRIGIVLLLPAIALSVVTGINISLCIVVMGTLSILYTVLGGIEAVIWTDVLQVIVLLGGAALCIVIVLFNIAGGFSGAIDIAASYNKMHTFDFAFDFTSPTLWVVLLGGLAANFISYGSDQAVIQRYLTTKDEKAAAKAIWTNGILCIPASLLFFGMGTALFVFYKTHPAQMNPTISNTDAIFPWYIVTQLPDGVAGVLIAAIFAAAMSSLDSSMNSVATAITTDFYRRFNPDAADHTCLKLARWITIIVGIAGTAFALMMAGWEIKSLWDQLAGFIGLFAGGLGGLFLLGILSRRATGTGAVIGLVASGLVQFIVKQYTPIHLLLYAFTGMASCIIIGYISSLIIPAKKKSLDGLTLSTLNKKALK
jgi:SSS family solute:Na+ symporter